MEHIKISPTNQFRPTAPPLDADWLAARIRLIFSAYRKDDYSDPEGFVMQLGMNLERFPREIVEYITDPVTGIQTRSKWPPQLAEVVEACLAEEAHRKKLEKYSNLPPAAERLPKPRFSAVDNYDAMVKKHGRPVGVFEKPNDRWNRE